MTRRRQSNLALELLLVSLVPEQVLARLLVLELLLVLVL